MIACPKSEVEEEKNKVSIRRMKKIKIKKIEEEKLTSVKVPISPGVIIPDKNLGEPGADIGLEILELLPLSKSNSSSVKESG